MTSQKRGVLAKVSSNLVVAIQAPIGCSVSETPGCKVGPVAHGELKVLYATSDGSCRTRGGCLIVWLCWGVQRTPRHAPAMLALAVKITCGAIGMLGGRVGGPAPRNHEMSKLTSPILIEDRILDEASSIFHCCARPSRTALSASSSKSEMSGCGGTSPPLFDDDGPDVR